MKQERDDRIGRALADVIQRRQPAGPCPDMDMFAAAVDNKLPEAELDEFRAHLAACPRCLEAYSAAHELAQDTVPSGAQFIRLGKWGASLLAVAAVAVLAIRLSQEPDNTKSLVATAPSPGAGLITPPKEQIQPTPEQKKSGTAASTPRPRQILLAFADADDFWNRAARGRDELQSRPSSRMRDFTAEPPVMSVSPSPMPPPKSDKERSPAPQLLPLQAFQIGVSLRQVQFARDAGDHAALAERQQVLISRLEAAGQHEAAIDTATDKLAPLHGLPHVRLGVWAESVREALAKDEPPDMVRLIADADTLLELGFDTRITADLEQIRSELIAKGVARTAKRDAILKLLTGILADL